jgi:hypothetical protein
MRQAKVVNIYTYAKIEYETYQIRNDITKSHSQVAKKGISNAF